MVTVAQWLLRPILTMMFEINTNLIIVHIFFKHTHEV